MLNDLTLSSAGFWQSIYEKFEAALMVIRLLTQPQLDFVNYKIFRDGLSHRLFKISGI